MKKIIILSIGLLSASVQAMDIEGLKISQTVAVLMQNADFVTNVHTLHKQGLTIEEIVAQVVLSDQKSAYFLDDMDNRPFDCGSFYDNPSPEGLIIFFALVVIGQLVCLMKSCTDKEVEEQKAE